MTPRAIYVDRQGTDRASVHGSGMVGIPRVLGREVTLTTVLVCPAV